MAARLLSDAASRTAAATHRANYVDTEPTALTENTHLAAALAGAVDVTGP